MTLNDSIIIISNFFKEQKHPLNKYQPLTKALNEQWIIANKFEEQGICSGIIKIGDYGWGYYCTALWNKT